MKTICALAVARRFPSIQAAASELGLAENNIYSALNFGHRAGGMWWVEAKEMAGPFKATHYVAVVREDGQRFPSLSAAVRSYGFQGVRAIRRETMKLSRYIRRRSPYHGSAFRFAGDPT